MEYQAKKDADLIILLLQHKDIDVNKPNIDGITPRMVGLRIWLAHARWM